MSIRNRSKGSQSLLTEEFPILLDIGVDTHSKPYNLAQFLDLLPRIFETLEISKVFSNAPGDILVDCLVLMIPLYQLYCIRHILRYGLFG